MIDADLVYVAVEQLLSSTVLALAYFHRVSDKRWTGESLCLVSLEASEGKLQTDVRREHKIFV